MQYAYTLYALVLIHCLFHTVRIDLPRDRRFDVCGCCGSALVFVDSYASMVSGKSNHYSDQFGGYLHIRRDHPESALEFLISHQPVLFRSRWVADSSLFGFLRQLKNGHRYRRETFSTISGINLTSFIKMSGRIILRNLSDISSLMTSCFAI